MIEYVLSYMLAGAIVEAGETATGAAAFTWGDVARWALEQLPQDAPAGWA
jgi:hypothetical protein